MDKLHHVAKGLLLYETLDADQFIQAFNEELSLSEKDVFEKREVSTDSLDDEVDEQKNHDTAKQNKDIQDSKISDFRSLEDDNK